MADRKDFYFRQIVREADLDQGFDFLEAAEFNLTVDNGLVGIQSGMTVAQTVVPSLSVQVAGGVAYSKQGERINIVGTQNLDISVDENSITTDPVTVGNSLVISVFVEFDRALGAPEVDGNSQTVYTLRAESYNLIVRKGGEAVSPGGGAEEAFITANAVPQDGDLIRICDIIRANGQTTIVDANIYEDVFREDVFVYNIGTLGVRAGTIKEADEANLQLLNDHINQLANGHDATSIAFDNAGVPAPWSNLAGSITVQGAINGIVVDLSAAGNGSALVGFDPTGIAWANAVDTTGVNVYEGLRDIVLALADTSITGTGTGTDRVGSDVINDTITSTAVLPQGTLREQLQTIADEFVHVEQLLEDEALIHQTNFPGDSGLPSATTDSYRLIYEMETLGGHVRWYSHRRCGLIVTINAKWNVAAGNWSSDVGGVGASRYGLDSFIGSLSYGAVSLPTSITSSPWVDAIWRDNGSGVVLGNSSSGSQYFINNFNGHIDGKVTAPNRRYEVHVGGVGSYDVSDANFVRIGGTYNFPGDFGSVPTTLTWTLVNEAGPLLAGVPTVLHMSSKSVTCHKAMNSAGDAHFVYNLRLEP